jgi:WD40 repeat protein
MTLINSLKSVKEDVADKMNEATEIYNKALGMMEVSSKQEVGIKKSGEKLDEYMLNTLSVPLTATVPEKPKFKISAHNQETLAVKYDNFGNSLATCGGDNLLKVWDPATGKEVCRFKDFTKPVTCLDYNLDGNLICAGSVDKTIRVFDLKTQRPKHCFTGHNDTINSISALVRSAKIVSGSSDRTIKFWDYEKTQILSTVLLNNS